MENFKEIDDVEEENVANFFTPTSTPILRNKEENGTHCYRRPNAHKPRLIRKSGKANITRYNLSNRWFLYTKDLANTLVESRWRWTLISLTSCFMLSWLIFATFYKIAADANGQFQSNATDEFVCFYGIESFNGYFLFSIETQATIGYGSRSITRHCPEAIFLMCLQIILGCAICGGIASIVLVKMGRPLALYSKSLFSKNAVICRRDGVLCLIFRVRDDCNRHIIGTNITAYLVEYRDNEPFLKTITLESYGILIWPLEIVHKITSESPFWNMSAKDLVTKRFELIVTMEGTSVTTNQCSKTITSYTSSEILWGQRFIPCVTYDEDMGSYCVNHKEFNKTKEVLTPLCSGQRLQEVLMDVECRASYSINNPIMELTNRKEIYANEKSNCDDVVVGGGDSKNVYEIDGDIYNYLSDIKEKINNEQQFNNNNVRMLRLSNSNVMDVECLIDNLREYVNENVSSFENRC